MVRIIRKTALFFLLIIAAAPSLSFAQQPLEALRQGIDKAIRVMEDPQFKDASRKGAQQQKLWEIMRKLFDFKEFSKRVLGSYWSQFTPSQHDEFVKVFSEFLGKFYLGRLQKRYDGQRLNYGRQQMIGKSRALVEVEVLWRKVTIPVQLRMTNRSGQWKVYDLNVFGINAVSNYRAQFQSILSKETPQQIIGRLKEKVAELDEKS